uniref:noggin-like n=1 Tax=Styela clava TaxID=7725 RepID=UPI00193A00BC|nr:noggin-like [Styela clava]
MLAKTLMSFVVLTMFAFDQTTSVALRENYFKLLPESSNALPVLDIPENPPNEYDPKESDLDPDRLREKLGISYKPDFMSPTEPDPYMYPNVGTSPRFAEIDRNNVRPFGKIPSRFRKIDFNQPNGKPVIKLSRRQRRKLQAWLWQATTCPVVYKWKNLGHRFWPPWIREGLCDTSRSCSIPAGMGCQPSDSVMITILRWHCQGFNSNKMRYCTWIKVQYPIISECKCKC